MIFNENGQSVTFTGAVSSDGTSASGSYTAPAGGCTQGDMGTWSETKTPPQLLSLILNPTSVIAGNAATGTITLSAAAPSGGAVVTLSSSNPIATVPQSVTVAAGNTTTTFSIATSASTTSTTVTITAVYSNAQTATLTVNGNNPQQNPVPAITSLSPSSTTVGTLPPGNVLVVNGTNFIAGSVVAFNGNARTTTFVSSTQLTVPMTSSDVASNATINVTVSNPAPGGGVSGSVPFTINPQQNPQPTISSLSPSSTAVGTLPVGGFLSVNGTNFVSNSGVLFNGNPRTTTFVSSTQLTAQVLASDVAANAAIRVTVSNPLPGGGVSGTLTFEVGTAVGLASLKLSPDAIVSGNTSTATIVASAPAPAGGVAVSLSSSETSAAVLPANVTIPNGGTSAQFTITGGGVTNPTSLTITATSATAQSATLIVNPATTVNWNGGPQPVGQVFYQCVTGDFNADGKTDLACYTGTSGNWDVALSTGGGWQLQAWNGGISGISDVSTCFAGDFNGDGKTDLACPSGTSGDWDVALSTGGGWQLQAWNGGAISSGHGCYADDFNGDGKTDLACYYGSPFGSGNWSVSLSTGTGWQLQAWNGGPAPVPVSWNCYTGDFNSDGKADIACYTFDGSGAWDMGISTGSGWDYQVWGGGPNPPWPSLSLRFLNCFSGDFNGDGSTDLACATATGGSWQLGLSTGSGWNGQIWSGGPVIALPANNQCFSGDFNDDSKADLVCYSGVGTGWGVGLSTGSSWQSGLWNGGPAPGEPVFGQCFTGDFNGDGKTDLACYTGGGGVWAVALSSGAGWWSRYPDSPAQVAQWA